MLFELILYIMFLKNGNSDVLQQVSESRDEC